MITRDMKTTEEYKKELLDLIGNTHFDLSAEAEEDCELCFLKEKLLRIVKGNE